MKPNSYEYACKGILLVKKNNNPHFYGDYKPLNLQTWWDSFPMLSVENILAQLGEA
jgi:hypothetical protein